MYMTFVLYIILGRTVNSSVSYLDRSHLPFCYMNTWASSVRSLQILGKAFSKPISKVRDEKNSKGKTKALNMFASPAPSGLYVHNINDTSVPFIEIWKGGHETINFNIFPMSGYQNSSYSRRYTRSSEINKLISTHQINSVSFIIVRDPIMRLISGMNECFFRKIVPIDIRHKMTSQLTYNDSKVLNKLYQQHAVNKSFVLDMLISTISQGYVGAYFAEVIHLYLMSNQLALLPKTGVRIIIGSLENIESDWPIIGNMYGLKFSPFKNGNDTRHVSSDDGFKLMATIKSILDENVLFSRALCTLLWRDYYCFSIKFPAVCQGINETEFNQFKVYLPKNSNPK